MDSLIPKPPSRRLRIFAFDPSLAGRYETADIGEVTAHLPWEQITPGPVGEYLEVIDADPATGVFYHPVDLDHPWLLAQDGLPPSETNPQYGSIRMRCAIATRTTARRRGRCSSVTSPSTSAMRSTRLEPSCLRACRRTSSRTKRPMACSMACGRCSMPSATSTCRRSMRPSPTSWRSFSIFRIREDTCTLAHHAIQVSGSGAVHFQERAEDRGDEHGAAIVGLVG